MFSVLKSSPLIQSLSTLQIIISSGHGTSRRMRIERGTSLHVSLISRCHCRSWFRFLETFKRCVSAQFAQRIAVMEKDAFPVLIVLTRNRGTLEVINVIEGKSTPAEVLSNLIQSHDAFNQQRQRDMEEETMRETREHLKKQQEDEYNRSLQADLAKEQARQADEQRQKEEQYTTERLKQKRLVRSIYSHLIITFLLISNSERTTRMSSPSPEGTKWHRKEYHMPENPSTRWWRRLDTTLSH